VWTQRTIDLLDDLERVALALVARIGPWLSPVAPAYAVHRAAVAELGYPRAVAWLMAAAIEAAGVSAFHVTLRLWAWNQERPEGSPSAPTAWGVGLIAVYLIVGIGLAVVVGLLPQLVPFAPASFFVLAGVGYAVLALMSDQARREALAKVEAKVKAEAEAKAEAERRDREQAEAEAVAQEEAERKAQGLASKAFWATVRERGIGRAEAQRVLAETGGEYRVALEALPEERQPSAVGGRPAAVTSQRVPEFDELLAIVREQSQGAAFGPADVRAWAGVGRTRAYELLGYGQRLGLVQRVAKGSYVYDGRGDESASQRSGE
jgi:hypothetical protein